MLVRKILVVLSSLIVLSSAQANTPNYQVFLEEIDGALRGSIAFEVSDSDWQNFLRHVALKGNVRGRWMLDNEEDADSWTHVERGRYFAMPLASDTCTARNRELRNSTMMKRKTQPTAVESSTYTIEVHYSCT